MTRINADLDPEILLDQHLMAEYRELPMVFAALKRSMRTKAKDDILSSIPPKFTLNQGHVRFFYDKLTFLHKRYEKLKDELFDRGFDLDENRKLAPLDLFPEEFRKDWITTPEENAVVVERILSKHKMKPSWYKFWSDPLTYETYTLLLTNH